MHAPARGASIPIYVQALPASAEEPAAVHEDVLPRDEIGAVPDEIEHGPDHVLGHLVALETRVVE